MHYRIYACALFLALGAIAHADALNKQPISPDAKWLVHIDCDNLRQTQVGDYLLNQFLIPKATEMTGDLKINVSNIVQRISSVTAFGTDFKKGPQVDGVLLINSDN